MDQALCSFRLSVLRSLFASWQRECLVHTQEIEYRADIGVRHSEDWIRKSAVQLNDHFGFVLKDRAVSRLTHGVHVRCCSA